MHDPIIVVIRFERAARHYCVVSLLLEYLIVFILFFGRLNIKSIDYGYKLILSLEQDGSRGRDVLNGETL